MIRMAFWFEKIDVSTLDGVDHVLSFFDWKQLQWTAAILLMTAMLPENVSCVCKHIVIACSLFFEYKVLLY